MIFSLLLCIGPLTHPLLDALDKGVFTSYNSYTRTLVHQGKRYLLATSEIGHFSDAPTVSICSAPFGREIIALDPQDSSFLDEKYAELLNRLKSSRSLEEILRATSHFIKYEIFSPEIYSEEALYQFLYDWTYDEGRTLEDFAQTLDGHFFPVIPLNTFAKARMGVCRHLAFVTAYFLDKLQKENSLRPLLPPGKTYLIRDQIQKNQKIGNHAWNLFVSLDKRTVWHIDTTWQLLDNPLRPRLLPQHYGERILQRERELASQ